MLDWWGVSWFSRAPVVHMKLKVHKLCMKKLALPHEF